MCRQGYYVYVCIYNMEHGVNCVCVCVPYLKFLYVNVFPSSFWLAFSIDVYNFEHWAVWKLPCYSVHTYERYWKRSSIVHIEKWTIWISQCIYLSYVHTHILWQRWKVHMVRFLGYWVFCIVMWMSVTQREFGGCWLFHLRTGWLVGLLLAHNWRRLSW